MINHVSRGLERREAAIGYFAFSFWPLGIYLLEIVTREHVDLDRRPAEWEKGVVWEKVRAVTVKGPGEAESEPGSFLPEGEPDPLACTLLLGDPCVSPAPRPQLA